MVMTFGTSSNRWTKIALKSSTNEGRSRVLALLQDQITGRLAVAEARAPSHKPLKDNRVFGNAGHRERSTAVDTGSFFSGISENSSNMHPPPTQTEGAVMKAEQQRLPRFAVLIDADNTSPLIAGGLFEEVAKFGEASVRRIYGDFSGPHLKSWSEILQKHAIDPYQQFAYTKGKNASDIALVIDAMDLLHSGRFDGFCLVTSDSDFTRLASRLREQGADVFGFGEQKTPESFRQACRKFIYTENLLPEAQVSTAEEGPSTKALQPPSAAIPILNKAMMQMETEDGWSAWARWGTASRTS